MPMTWEQLAAEIAKMPPDKRQDLVYVREPYDEGAANLTVDYLTTADGPDEEMTDEEREEALPEGTYYLV